MANQNRFSEVVVAGKNTAANLKLSTTYPWAAGELAYATDTKQLYVGTDPSTGGSFVPIIRQPTSAPSSPVAGDSYFDTATNKFYCYNGTGWKSVTLT